MWKRINGRRVRVVLDANKDGAGGWEWGDATDTSDTSKDDSGKQEEGKKTPDNVPYDRFKEVNDANKVMKAKLAEYEKKEAEEAEKKRLADEEEAKKKGEFEKLLTQKDQELADLKKQQETWKAREESVSKRNEERIASLSKKFWDEWEWVKNLIEDITDPFVLSGKLDSMDTLVGKKDSTQKWGSKVPWSWGQTRKQELMEKLQKTGTLTAKEQSELLGLADKKD